MDQDCFFFFFLILSFSHRLKTQINHSYVSVSAFFLCTVFIPSVFSVARNSTPLPARGMHRKFEYGHVSISWWLVPFASGDHMGGQLRCSFPIFVIEFERGFWFSLTFCCCCCCCCCFFFFPGNTFCYCLGFFFSFQWPARCESDFVFCFSIWWYRAANYFSLS